jgi:hypothetical protein
MSLRGWFALLLVMVVIGTLLILGAPDPFASLPANPQTSPLLEQAKACRLQGGTWEVTYSACRYR